MKINNEWEEYANKLPKYSTIKHMEYMSNIQVEANFNFQQITGNYVLEIIHDLKSSGHDDINSIILKEITNVISKPLKLIINQSIQNGIFPDKLKVSNIIKRGDRHYK